MRWRPNQQKKKVSITIISIGNTERKAPCVSAEISFGGEQFVDDFVLQDDFGIVIQGDKPFLGLLGINFMLRHRLVADFSSHTVYRSFVNHSNFFIADTDFFFPMGIGLNFYGVPVVGLKTQGDDIVAALDSGSHENIIAEAVLPQVSPNHHYTGEQTDTVCYTCTVKSKEVEAEFSLLGVNNDGNEKIYNKVSDHFLVVKSHIFFREQPENTQQEDHLPPVNALIGSNFMNSNGWILDFGAQFIYKRHAPLSA